MKKQHHTPAERAAWMAAQVASERVLAQVKDGFNRNHDPKRFRPLSNEAPGRLTVQRRWKASMRQKNAGKRLELSHLRTVGAFGAIRFAGERINPIAQQLAA